MKAVMDRLRMQPIEAYLLFGLMPLLLPFVRRAGPPLVIIAAMASCLQLLSDRKLRNASTSTLTSFPVLVGGAFLCWATATLFWTPWLSRGAAAVASGWLMLGALLALNARPAAMQPPSASALLSVTVTASSLAVAVNLIARRLDLFEARTEAFHYNMVLVSLVLLFCGCLRRDGGARMAPLAPATCLAVAVALGESETAKVAFAAAVVAYVATQIIPHKVIMLGMAGGLCLIWFGFPWIAPVAAKLVTFFPGLAKSGHAAERIEIWSAFSQLAVAGLPRGWGVESVAMAPGLSFFETAAPSTRAGLDWMHPHNNVIQIAAEMGGAGIILGLASSLVAVWWVQADPKLTPPRAALVAALLTVALISHGFWQMWFWSAVVAAVVSLRTPGDLAPLDAGACER